MGITQFGSHPSLKALGGSLAGLLILSPALAAAEPGSPPCLEAVTEKAGRNQKLTVLLRGGESLEGEFRGVKETSSLQLRMYDPRASRFTTRDIPQSSIASIEFGRHPVSPLPPILGAVVLGGVGVLLGNEYDVVVSESPDQGHGGAITGGVLGAVTGAVFGLVLAGATGKTEYTRISCDPSSAP